MLSTAAVASALVGAAMAGEAVVASTSKADNSAYGGGWGGSGYGGGSGWGSGNSGWGSGSSGWGSGSSGWGAGPWGGGSAPWFGGGGPGYGGGYGSASLWAAPSACNDVCQPVIALGVQCGLPGQIGNNNAVNCVCTSNNFNVRNIGGLCNSCLSQNNWNNPIMQTLASSCQFNTVNYTPQWNDISKRSAAAGAPADGVQMKWGGGDSSGGWGGGGGSWGGAPGGAPAAAPAAPAAPVGGSAAQQGQPLFFSSAPQKNIGGALFGLSMTLGIAYILL